MKTFTALLTLTALASSVKLPQNFQKCARNRPDFKNCVFKAAQNGIPQLNKPYDELTLPNLEPLHLEEITIGGLDGPVTLQQKFKNCDLYGLSTLQVDQFVFDFDKNEIKISGMVPEIRILGQYEVKGRVLLLPVDGRGDATIILSEFLLPELCILGMSDGFLEELKIEDVLSFEQKKKKNGTYLSFRSSRVGLEPGLVIFDFRSAVSKNLSDRFNPVLNENWKLVFEDVQRDYEELIDKIVLSLANSFFSKVSVEEAFD
ncbi:protein takeout-like [Zophobas morio]|uniref:protein takeout-like n=1 Tax=Zophobas morio TaxID=2755281 RepID=UPI003082A7BE